MKSSDEMIKELYESRDKYLEEKKKRQSKTIKIISPILGIAIVALVGLGVWEIGLFKKSASVPDSFTEPFKEPTKAENITPTEIASTTVTPEPTGISVQRVLVSEKSYGYNVENSGFDGSSWGSGPVPGTIYISENLDKEMKKYSGRGDVLFFVRIHYHLWENDEEVKNFKDNYYGGIDKEPLLTQYLEEMKTFERSEDFRTYYDKMKAEGAELSNWPPNTEEVFDPLWKENHTEEEWNQLQAIIKEWKRKRYEYNDSYEAIVAPIYSKESIRLQESDYGVVVSYDRGYISYLMSPEQYEKFVPSERFYYSEDYYYVSEDIVERLIGMIPDLDPANEIVFLDPDNPFEIDDSDPKIDEKLRGVFDKDDPAVISLIFGDLKADSEEWLAKEHPDEYKAYLWTREINMIPALNDDPQVISARRAWDLIRSFSENWRKENLTQFFERHSDYVQYQLEENGVYFCVPYSLIPEIAKDPGIVSIMFGSLPTYRLALLGHYNGKKVYIMEQYLQYYSEFMYTYDD